MKFLLTGGRQRKFAVWGEEWHFYNLAILLKVDWLTGVVESLLEYISPPELIAEKNANIVFKAGYLYKNKLYLCTQTEVLIYEYPSLNLRKYLSLPCFNDVHHVAIVCGKLTVVSTGLDMVVFLDENYIPIKYINVLGKEAWHKFSPEIDYRKILTTKPHESHPNYIFEIDGDIWVSRFEQKDAICLMDMSKRINIGLERVHDGIVVGDYVYFTTVNGTICVAHKYTHKVEFIYDLNDAYDEHNPLGWCRGLHVEGNRIFVGFSSLRSTKLRENLAWIKRRFKVNKKQMRAMPTRVIEYDMKSRSVIKEVNVSGANMDAIFSIHKVD